MASLSLENSVRFGWREIVSLLEGAWDVVPSDNQFPEGICGVSDDSRSVPSGGLFLAVKGEMADGHDFIAKAVERRVAAVVVQRPLPEALREDMSRSGCGCLRVPDTLLAFHTLAGAQRLRCTGALRLVGITGSCGKTSTKEMIASVLDRVCPGQVLKTEGNTNNYFGVPRNLLRLTDVHRAAVIEMGTNHPGEIAVLTRMVQPDIAVVSNVGHAHLEHFRSLEGVAREKGDILAGSMPDGRAILPFESPGADILRTKAGERRILTFGVLPDADIRLDYLGKLNATEYGVDFSVPSRGERGRLVWKIGGRHQAMNAGAAVAVAVAMDIPLPSAVEGLQTCVLPAMRMELREYQGVTWVNDAYNANPDSMQAALEWFSEAFSRDWPDRVLLILGDMLELGDESRRAHEAVLEWAVRLGDSSCILTVGEHMRDPSSALGIRWFPDADTARPAVLAEACTRTAILVKGSRGIRLERLLP